MIQQRPEADLHTLCECSQEIASILLDALHKFVPSLWDMEAQIDILGSDSVLSALSMEKSVGLVDAILGNSSLARGALEQGFIVIDHMDDDDVAFARKGNWSTAKNWFFEMWTKPLVTPNRFNLTSILDGQAMKAIDSTAQTSELRNTRVL